MVKVLAQWSHWFHLFLSRILLFERLLKMLWSQHRFDHLTLMHVFYGLVDFVEGVEGDHAVKGKAPLAVEIKKSGDEEI